jgi:hypothetical protein
MHIHAGKINCCSSLSLVARLQLPHAVTIHRSYLSGGASGFFTHAPRSSHTQIIYGDGDTCGRGYSSWKRSSNVFSGTVFPPWVKCADHPMRCRALHTHRPSPLEQTIREDFAQHLFSPRIRSNINCVQAASKNSSRDQKFFGGAVLLI